LTGEAYRRGRGQTFQLTLFTYLLPCPYFRRRTFLLSCLHRYSALEADVLCLLLLYGKVAPGVRKNAARRLGRAACVAEGQTYYLIWLRRDSRGDRDKTGQLFCPLLSLPLCILLLLCLTGAACLRVEGGRKEAPAEDLTCVTRGMSLPGAHGRCVVYLPYWRRARAGSGIRGGVTAAAAAWRERRAFLYLRRSAPGFRHRGAASEDAKAVEPLPCPAACALSVCAEAGKAGRGRAGGGGRTCCPTPVFVAPSRSSCSSRRTQHAAGAVQAWRLF